jgi:hypothetical protein
LFGSGRTRDKVIVTYALTPQSKAPKAGRQQADWPPQPQQGPQGPQR